MTFLVNWLLDPSGLTPHGFCLLWEPWLIWTHALANVAIGTAYFSIPVVLVQFARRRRDLVFRPVFWLFAAFILLCGTGHWVSLLTLWYALYGVEAVVKAATAAVSVVTAVALWPLLPKALMLPSPAQMRAANEALRESEARHRASFTGAPVALHILDLEGRIVEVSDRWADLLGYSRAEVIGRCIAEFQEDAGQATFASLKTFLAAGEILEAPRRFIRRDGAVLAVLVSARLERDGEGRPVRIISAVVDVTARVQAELALRASEEQLRQAQKMEAIGQLTGGVAHDFNNMLQAVTGNLGLIRRRVQDVRPDLARLADNALEASSKAAGLTSQLLSIARRQKLRPQPLDPVSVVDGMRDLLSRTVGAGIAFQVASEPGGFCLADRNQLESALLNLVINARDALDGRGTITVTVGSQEVAQAPGGWPPSGPYIRIAVQDDGPGMSEEVRRRAFEPFFTTKGPGHGSGLGLAQIHGFAHQSGGTAMIESAPGHGTEVVLLLPRTSAPAQKPVEQDQAALGAEETARGRGENVLVVEDDALVRSVLSETLRDLGYRSIAAENADEALAMLASGTVVEVIVSDVTMPGSMDGVEFAHTVRSRLPDAPIILATGHPGALRNRSLPSGVELIQKPQSRASIGAAIRRVLDQAVQPVDA